MDIVIILAFLSHMHISTHRSSNFFLISNLAFLVLLGSFSESLFTIVLSNGTSTEYLKVVKKNNRKTIRI